MSHSYFKINNYRTSGAVTQVCMMLPEQSAPGSPLSYTTRSVTACISQSPI